MSRKSILYFLCCLSVFFFVSCSDETADTSEDESGPEETTGEAEESIVDAETGNDGTHEVTDDYVWNASDVINVILKTTSIEVVPESGVVSGSKFTITSAGTYNISGTLADGTIIVSTEDDETVRLILNGVDISSSTTAPINVENASKVIVILADNTINVINDATIYDYPSSDVDEPNAAIFSTADLTIYGNGELMVNGNFNDGIASKDGLLIRNASVTVTAVDDGIRGKDYIIGANCDLSVSAKGDGLKSDNEDDAALGYISIESGAFNIISGGDAINATTDLLIKDGIFSLVSGGGSSKTAGDTSTKGMKANVNVIIDAGEFSISSADDAIHSNNSIVINGGIFMISSGDDGIHADEQLTFNGGEITITKSYEGVESSNITIEDGAISIVASDDGLNVAGGTDGSGWGGPQGGFSSSSDYHLNMNGGYVFINSKGDGVDVNGAVTMTNGTIVVSGPADNGNAALDYDASFVISGGFVLATGSSGMAQMPGTSSTQKSVLITLSSAQQASTLVHLQNSSGETLFTYKPAKQFQSIAFSSPDLVNGSYSLYLGGSAMGDEVDGLYYNGSYSGGTLAKSFTVSSINTSVR